jgi:hypothetical protein
MPRDVIHTISRWTTATVSGHGGRSHARGTDSVVRSPITACMARSAIKWTRLVRQTRGGLTPRSGSKRNVTKPSGQDRTQEAGKDTRSGAFVAGRKNFRCQGLSHASSRVGSGREGASAPTASYVATSYERPGSRPTTAPSRSRRRWASCFGLHPRYRATSANSGPMKVLEKATNGRRCTTSHTLGESMPALSSWPERSPVPAMMPDWSSGATLRPARDALLGQMGTASFGIRVGFQASF